MIFCIFGYLCNNCTKPICNNSDENYFLNLATQIGTRFLKIKNDSCMLVFTPKNAKYYSLYDLVNYHLVFLIHIDLETMILSMNLTHQFVVLM